MTATAQPPPLTLDAILGSWRLISWTYRVTATGERRDALGQYPRGSILYTPERVMVLLLNNHRKRPLRLPPADDEKIALFDTMFDYSGTHTVEPDRIILHLDMSWNEASTGTEQVWFCTIQGNILTLTSTPAKNPLDGREVVHEMIFERATRRDV